MKSSKCPFETISQKMCKPLLLFTTTIHRINNSTLYGRASKRVGSKIKPINTEGWAKKFARTKPIIATVGAKSLDLLSLSEMVILTVSIAIMSGLVKA